MTLRRMLVCFDNLGVSSVEGVFNPVGDNKAFEGLPPDTLPSDSFYKSVDNHDVFFEITGRVRGHRLFKAMIYNHQILSRGWPCQHKEE